MLYSTPEINSQPGGREHHRDPVCEPCGRAYERRHAYRASIVPLTVHEPLPAFKDIAGGHRLVDHPERGAQCHDCGRTGGTDQFKLSMLHACPARPESVNSREPTQADICPDTTRDELASRCWKYVTHEVGMGIEDWRQIKDDRLAVATFTFRDREYVLLHSPSSCTPQAFRTSGPRSGRTGAGPSRRRSTPNTARTTSRSPSTSTTS
ncbi:hypothetical protein [Streptomyces umbrinus]|uniref:hypothetical protein n=1 Tax=Streptomyces umbrinus TaxID=67370 RepID=UPI001679416A|nr:hypothetical protein [Streptomyces umbrinus]